MTDFQVRRMNTTQFFQLFMVLVWLAGTEALCPLCGDVNKMPNWWDYDVGDGRTCKELYVELGNVAATSSKCSLEQSNHGNFCCGSNRPSGQGGGGSGYKYSGPVGDQPDCPICRREDLFPADPTYMINARYVGTFSCATLYYRGINGMIPRDMCSALQGHAWTECKCNTGIPPPGEPTNLNDIRKTPPTDNNRQRIRNGRGGSAGGNY